MASTRTGWLKCPITQLNHSIQDTSGTDPTPTCNASESNLPSAHMEGNSMCNPMHVTSDFFASACQFTNRGDSTQTRLCMCTHAPRVAVVRQACSLSKEFLESVREYLMLVKPTSPTVPLR